MKQLNETSEFIKPDDVESDSHEYENSEVSVRITSEDQLTESVDDQEEEKEQKRKAEQCTKEQIAKLNNTLFAWKA